MARRAAPPPAALLALLLPAVAVLLAGCVASASPPEPTPAATARPVFQPGAPPPTPEAEGTPAGPLSGADVARILREAVCWYDDADLAAACVPPGEETVAVLERIANSGDERFLAPLVDMLALDIGWSRYVREALERVSGTSQPDTAAWYRWLWERDPPLPEGYAEWKGRLLTLVDVRFADLLDADLGDLPPEELLWGEIRVDGLPPLVGPSTVHRVEQRFLAASDVVYGVRIGDEALAFPERIVGWHEVVRSTVDGVPVVLTACVPCGSAAAYRATASDGTAYSLGTSGLVYHGRRLLHDAETGSLWDPVSGRAIGGPLAAEGVRLLPVLMRRTTWGDWSERNPDTRVLSLNTGHVRDYDEGAALASEAALDAPRFPVPALDGRLPAKERVFGLVVGGEARAYPLSAVEAARIVHDTIGGREVVLVSLGPGTGVTVYDESDVTFVDVRGPLDALEALDEDELPWFMDEGRLLNSRNSRVRESIPGRVAYWYAWADAFPGTSIWGQ